MQHLKRQQPQTVSQLQHIQSLRQQQMTYAQSQIPTLQPQQLVDQQISLAQQQQKQLQRASSVQKLAPCSQASLTSQSTLRNQQSLQEKLSPQAENPETQDCLYEAELLQMKLKKESDKLIEWKVQQTMKNSELERKLKESEDVRERQRKNILELQMQLEKETQKYIIETKNREDLSEKVENAKIINQQLRQYCSRMSSIMEACKKAAGSVESNQKEIYDEVNTMHENFHNMHETFVKKCDDLQGQLTEVKEKYAESATEANKSRDKLALKVENISKQLQKEVIKREETEKKLSASLKTIEELTAVNNNLKLDSQKRLEALLSTVEAKKVEIMKLEAILKESEKKWYDATSQNKTISAEKEELQKKLEVVISNNVAFESKIVSQESQISALQCELDQCNEVKNNYISEMEKSQAAYRELKSEFEQQLEERNTMQERLDILSAEVNEKNSKLTNLEEDHQKETQNLKAAIESNLADLERLSMQLQQQEDSSNDLQAAMSTKDSEVHSLQSKIEELESIKSQQCNMLQDLTLTLENVTKEKFELCEKYESEILKITELNIALNNAAATEKLITEKYEKLMQSDAEKSEKIEFLTQKLNAVNLEKEAEVLALKEENKKIQEEANDKISQKEVELIEVRQKVLQQTSEETAELVKERDKKIEKLEKDLEEYKNLQRKMSENMKSTEESLAEKDKLILKSETALKNITKEKDDLKKANEKFEYEIFQNQMAMQELIRNLEDGKKDMDKRLETKEANLKEKDMDIESLKKSVFNLEEAIKKSKEAQEKLQQEKDELEKANKSKEVYISKLNMEVTDLKASRVQRAYDPIASSTPIPIVKGYGDRQDDKVQNTFKSGDASIDYDEDAIFAAPPKKRVTFDFSDEGSDSSVDLLSLSSRIRKRSTPHFISIEEKEKTGFKKVTSKPSFIKITEKKPKTWESGRSKRATSIKSKLLGEASGDTDDDLTGSSSKQSSNRFFRTRTKADKSSQELDVNFEDFFN